MKKLIICVAALAIIAAVAGTAAEAHIVFGRWVCTKWSYFPFWHKHCLHWEWVRWFPRPWSGHG